MKYKNNDPLIFLDRQKYILLILLFLSLGLSYFIESHFTKKEAIEEDQLTKQRNKSRLELMDKNRKYEFVDYEYHIWYDRAYPSYFAEIVLGSVFEELKIERFLEYSNRKVPLRRSSNNYDYFNFFYNVNFSSDEFINEFNKQKDLFIKKHKSYIDQFKSRGESEKIYAVELEYTLFLLNEIKINVEKRKRVRYLTNKEIEKLLEQYSPIYVPKKLEINNSDDSDVSDDLTPNTSSIEKERKSFLQMFFYPELIILLTYFIYFTVLFLIQIRKKYN